MKRVRAAYNQGVPNFPRFQKIPFTQAAYTQMQVDLETALQEQQAVLERLQVAREMGDLSENGAYKYAKFELGNVRRKIRRLQRLLQHGEVVQKQGNLEEVGFASAVTLLVDGKQVSYTIVSKHESDPQKGFLSQESPLGRALLGRKVGDRIQLQVPAGLVTYEILQIQ